MYLLLLLFTSAASSTQLSLQLGNIVSPSFTAKNVVATLSSLESGALDLDIGELKIQNNVWHKTKLHCAQFSLEKYSMHCDSGELRLGKTIPISFNYSFATKKFFAELKPTPKESWKVSAFFGYRNTTVDVAINNGSVQWLSAWLPDNAPRPSDGRILGSIRWREQSGKSELESELELKNLNFSDSSGLHAGEKLAGKVSLQADKKKDRWLWQARVYWNQGAIFWDPFYLTSEGHKLVARGQLQTDQLRIDNAEANFVDVGNFKFSALWDIKKKSLTELDLSSPRFNLARAHTLFLQPLLKDTVFAQTQAKGEGKLRWLIRDGLTQNFDLDLHAASLQDDNNRFGLTGVEAHIPWQRENKGTGQVTVGSATLGLLPLGKFELPIEMHGFEFNIPNATLSILDGTLSLSNFSAALNKGTWRWQVSSELTPVSMERLTHTFNVPDMFGTMSAVVPQISYQESTLVVDGALTFKVFDGTVIAKNLKVTNPFGALPILSSDLDMKYLDLGLLTKAFSFGSVEGRMDATVTNLELVNWQPQHFRAKLTSSKGSYPKIISQRAVQNITALGGGSAGAIQQSLLRFFDKFHYEKLGVGCVLENNTCQMSGIERAPQGYIIVKGGGIPSLNVIGYNRAVGWEELVNRLKAVISGNAEIIIK